jgi:hypothetical protein
MRRCLSVALVAAAAACSTDLGSGPPSEFDGIKYTAEVQDIVSGSSGARQFAVVVTLQNLTSSTKTRTYPATCPVRVRLYRSSDNFLAYDETLRSCSPTPTSTITIPAQGTSTLTSGVRFPATVAGDSLATGQTTYTVRAIVTTEGDKEVLIDAGTTHLRGTQ